MAGARVVGAVFTVSTPNGPESYANIVGRRFPWRAVGGGVGRDVGVGGGGRCTRSRATWTASCELSAGEDAPAHANSMSANVPISPDSLA